MSPTSGIPPALPPSVEEAYRRKCIQLKQRTAEVEEANDAANIRLNRLKRQVEKMRLERAFLLEQLARRTSTNVEDSDGSPSPPPTPKEKPLRIKRGHRKASLLPAADTPPPTARPSGSAPETTPSAPAKGTPAATMTPDGARSAAAPAAAASGFELYCRDARPALLKEARGGRGDDDDEDDEDDDDDDAVAAQHPDEAAVEDELERAWKALPEERRKEFQARSEKEAEESEKAAGPEAEPEVEMGGGDKDGAKEGAERAAEEEAEVTAEVAAEVAAEVEADEKTMVEEKSQEADGDVEMGTYDTDQDAGAGKQED